MIQKTRPVTISLTDDEHQQLKQFASEENLTLSAYVRAVCLAHRDEDQIYKSLYLTDALCTLTTAKKILNQATEAVDELLGNFETMSEEEADAG